jgi:acetyl esterase
MAKEMTQKQIIARAKMLRVMAYFTVKLRSVFNKKIYFVRSVKTQYGDVSVLEYGFGDKEPKPLFIDMHGGGFILMTAESDDELNKYFLSKTSTRIISIDYPKAPEHPYPCAVEAVHEVCLHYFKNAKEYGIDPKHVGIGGHSAGATLSTVECMVAKEKGDLSYRFQMLDYPPLDLKTSALDKPKPKGALPPNMALFFDKCYVKPEQAGESHASPVYATKEELVGLPPALVILAGMDSLHDEGLKYSNMLKDAGVQTEVHEFPNATHGFTLKPSVDTTKAMQLMAYFINKNI